MNTATLTRCRWTLITVVASALMAAAWIIALAQPAGAEHQECSTDPIAGTMCYPGYHPPEPIVTEPGDQPDDYPVEKIGDQVAVSCTIQPPCPDDDSGGGGGGDDSTDDDTTDDDPVQQEDPEPEDEEPEEGEPEEEPEREQEILIDDCEDLGTCDDPDVPEEEEDDDPGGGDGNDPGEEDDYGDNGESCTGDSCGDTEQDDPGDPPPPPPCDPYDPGGGCFNPCLFYPYCQPPPPPPPPPAPSPPASGTAPVPSLVCRDDTSGGLEATTTWTPQSDTAQRRTQYRIAWSLGRGSNTVVRTSDVGPSLPPPTRTTITTASDGLAAGDQVTATVQVRAASRTRTSASNAYGTTYSPWSPWSAWSAWSSASHRVGPGGEPFTDTNGNGRRDNGEPFTDTNSNGVRDAGEPFTDIGNGRWDPGESYTDAADGVWNSGESYTDVNGNGRYDPGGDSFTDLNGNGVWDNDVDVLFDFNGNDIWDGAEPLHDPNNNFMWDGGIIVDVPPAVAADPVQLAAFTRPWFDIASAEPYTDNNGNGSYDPIEPFVDVPNGRYDVGEAFVDAGDGVYNPPESYTDSNGNGRWDPATGCPTPTSTGTPPPVCPGNPTDIAAVYPPGHSQAGQPTGVCYPPGHQCLPPPHGTGAADVLCLPRGS